VPCERFDPQTYERVICGPCDAAEGNAEAQRGHSRPSALDGDPGQKRQFMGKAGVSRGKTNTWGAYGPQGPFPPPVKSMG